MNYGIRRGPAVAAIALAVAVLLIAKFAPLSHVREPVVRITQASGHMTLNAGQTVRHRFLAKSPEYSRVVLYAGNDHLDGQQLLVRILDPEGKEVVHGQNFSVSYRQPEDTLRLTVFLPWFKPEVGKLYTMTATLESGPPLLLKTIERGDVVFALEKPALAPTGERQGIVAGVIFLLGAILVSWLPAGRKQWWAAGALLAAIVPLAYGGFWFSPDRLGIADWDYYFSLHENYRQILLHYHSFPFWNPYTCGGTAGLGDPEFPLFTPTFLLELIFGIPAGLRLAIYFSVAVLAVGLLALARRLKLSPLAGMTVAIIGAFSTVSRLELVEGHVNQFVAMWIPWIFWAWIGAYRYKSGQRFFPVNRYTLLCALFLAATFYGGGIYLLLYTALAFITLFALVSRRWHAIKITITAAAISLGLVALKLLPVLAWLHQFKSIRYASSTATIGSLYEIFLGRHLHGAYVLLHQNGGWQEYGAYIGLGAVVLACIGLAGFTRQRLVKQLAIGAVLAVLMSSTGPYLKPYFDHMNFFPRSTISRIVVFAVYVIALLAGIGFDRLRRQWPKVHPWLPLVIGLMAIDVMSLTYQISEQAFVLPPVIPAVAPAPSPIAFTTKRYDVRGDDNRLTRTYAATLAGYGTTAYCTVLSPAPLIQTIHDENGGPAVLVKDANARYSLVSWLPNRVEVLVSAPAATEVVINTNYAHGWYANNQKAISIDGRVGFHIPAGEQSVVFSYHTPGFDAGLSITLGTLVALGIYLWKQKQAI